VEAPSAEIASSKTHSNRERIASSRVATPASDHQPHRRLCVGLTQDQEMLQVLKEKSSFLV
jgi:hypothetical protein